MGIYGKYTCAVRVFSYVQIVAGLLMIAHGLALRVLVCSWITDASFGFWIGLLVIRIFIQHRGMLFDEQGNIYGDRPRDGGLRVEV